MTGEEFLRTVPRQQRSRDRLEAILDAFGVVLDRQGMEALSMTAVATEAGIPAASLYDYVPDTRHLLGCFVGRFFDQNYDEMASSLTAVGTAAEARTMLRAIFVGYIRRYQTQPGIFAALAFVDSDPDLARMHLNDSHRTARGFEAMLAPFVPQSDRPSLAHCCLFASHLAGSAARAILLSPEELRDDLIGLYIDLFTGVIPSLRSAGG